MTSQSTVSVRSPRRERSTTGPRVLPISRCFSWVLPPILPMADSLGTLFCELLGSIEYSAVTQPWPFPCKKGGTFSSTVAEQIIFVFPISIKTEPSANFRKFLFIETVLNQSAFLPSVRIITGGLSFFQFLFKVYHTFGNCPRDIFSDRGKG